jgi:predicted DNA-binding protein (MmcQ/YjbR family)
LDAILNFDQAQKYILAKPEALLDFPFGDDVSVFKIRNKMFALLSLQGEQVWLNLKCDPDRALALRDIFEGVKPGYHMNKKHWNTVVLDGSIPAGEVERMIDHSYGLVVSRLPKKLRLSLEIKYEKSRLYNEI